MFTSGAVNDVLNTKDAACQARVDAAAIVENAKSAVVTSLRCCLCRGHGIIDPNGD